jgi:hypothetical protein
MELKSNMIKFERCGSELGAGEKVRVCKKWGSEHKFINGQWEMTCVGGEICEPEQNNK